MRQAVPRPEGPFDVLVIGAGSAGCVVAARLSEDPARRVCLVEAGPDYGPYSEGRWPADILNAAVDALESHDWGFPGGASSARARIVGGCSAHNGCGIVWPAPLDLDSWRTAGGPAWSFEAMRPFLELAERELRARPSLLRDLEPWRRAFLAASLETGFPWLPSLNDPGAREGIGLLPVNAVGAVRWNTAFAYLDAARGRPNLQIRPGALVDRLVVAGDRARGATVVADGRSTTIEADTVVLAAGAYATPAILLRSGIGDASQLEALGIRVHVPLRGVGRNLADHPTLDVALTSSDHLERAAGTHAPGTGPAAQCLLKVRRPGSSSAWDLVLGPWTATPDAGAGGVVAYAGILVTVSKPRSLGHVSLRSGDPAVLPAIEHGFLADPDARDLEAMRAGIEVALQLARSDAAESWLGDAAVDGVRIDDGSIRAETFGNFHPCGTCRMGAAHDPDAVVDGEGRVHGLANVRVVDASIMPTIPCANIHLTVVAVAERLAAVYAEASAGRASC